ncbi:MAG: TonB-dependent receptor [Candidatus Kapabacteria bacterium]|nr:TonB-dependent receptor [Candidatus Kapabacteria bacterium]
MNWLSVHVLWAFFFAAIVSHGQVVPQRDTLRSKHVTDSLRTYIKSQVVVTGTRNEVRLKDSPVRVEVIGKDRIATSAMSDVGDLLKEQSGILITGAVRNGIQMNGLGPDYTLILIDGQPIIGRVAGVIDISRISVGNVERVEVVKGPMSSMYGSDALAGVVNIITKRPSNGFNGSAMVQAVTRGPIETRIEGGWGSDSLEITGFLNYKNQPQFTLPLGPLTIPYSGYQDGTAQGKIQWRFAKGWTARSWLRFFGSETRGTFIESFAGQIAQNSGSVQQWDGSATAGIEYQSGRARLTINAYGSSYNERYNFDSSQGTAGSTDDLIRRIGRLYGQYDVQLGAANRLTLGGEFLYDDISGSRYRDSTGDHPYYRTVVGFGQWEGMPSDWISYVVSARYDGNSVFGSAVNPRLSILWKPGDNVRASGSIGTGFKAPDFRQLYVSFSNRLAGAGYDLIGAERLGNTLVPERSVSYDLSLRYEDGQRQLSNSFSLLYNAEIRAFRNDLKNLIEYYYVKSVDGRAVYSYRNIANAYTQGIELNLRLALAVADVGLFSVLGGYQFLDAKDVQVLNAIDSGTAGSIDGPLTRDSYYGLWGRSRNSGTLRVQYDTEDHLWSANVRFQFIGRFGDESLDKNGIVITDPPRKVLDRLDEFVSGYTVVNIAATRSFMLSANRVLIGAGINNLLDHSQPTLVPGLVGRQYYIQMSTTF